MLIRTIFEQLIGQTLHADAFYVTQDTILTTLGVLRAVRTHTSLSSPCIELKNAVVRSSSISWKSYFL
jgi:hypothetical protein